MDNSIKIKIWLLNQLNGDEKGDKWGHRWRGTQKIRYEETIEFVKKNIDVNKKYDILDIGCSHGDFTKVIVETFKNSNIFATDISENAIKSAKKYVGKGDYEISELPNLPFRGKKFDLIFAIEVLYYLEEKDRLKSFENIYNKLNKGGYFVFSSVIDDGGGRYFDENDAIEKIKKYFKILDIGYVRTKGAVKFEQFFMRFILYYNILQNIDVYKSKKYSNGLKSIIVKLLSNKIVNLFIKILIYPFYKVSELIISSKTIMKIIKNMTIICCEKKVRGNILIIGRKISD